MEGNVRLEEHRDFPNSDWLRIVEACGGNPLHLPATHLIGTSPETLRFLLFKCADDVVACALGMIHRYGILGRLNVGPIELILPTAPAFADTEYAQEVFGQLLSHGRRSGYTRLTIHPQSSAHLECHPPFERKIRESLIEFVLDLRCGREDVLKGMHKSHRKNKLKMASTLDSKICKMMKCQPTF